MKFTELGLDDQLIEAISYMGFEEATPIQEKAIPEIQKGRDVLGCAQTGTGKTAAFLLPSLDNLLKSGETGTNTLIIVPTRELAVQIEQQIQAVSYFSNIGSTAIYGGGSGVDFTQEKRALTEGSEIIVATPGKLISHLNLGYVKFETVKHLILDEADRMLDMGFREDIEKIISHLPKERQTLLFSATMPKKIRDLAKEILNDPFEVTIALSKPAEGVLQAAYLVHNNQKDRLVKKLIADKPKYERIIIFTSRKRTINDVLRALRGNGYSVEGISSDFDQKDRERVLASFRSAQTRVLVGTDVVSRGIDIANINLVINYDVPGNAEDYVHRVGRTARASTTGVALTLVNQDDMHKFKDIEDLIDMEVKKVPLPPEIGQGPEWNPNYIPPRKGRGGKGKGKGRKGGYKGKRRK